MRREMTTKTMTEREMKMTMRMRTMTQKSTKSRRRRTRRIRAKARANQRNDVLTRFIQLYLKNAFLLLSHILVFKPYLYDCV